jgi:hypothetical protein
MNFSTPVLINMGADLSSRSWKTAVLKRRLLYSKKFSHMLVN